MIKTRHYCYINTICYVTVLGNLHEHDAERSGHGGKITDKPEEENKRGKAQGGPLPTSLNAYYAALPAALYTCNTRSRDVNHCGNHSVSRSGASFLPPDATRSWRS